MKFVLRFNSVSYFKRRVEWFYEGQKEIHKRNTSMSENENRLMLSSLEIFRKNIEGLFDILEDPSSPLHKLSKKNIDLLFDSIEDAVVYDTISYYYRKPLAFIYDMLSIILVSNTSKKPLVDSWTSGLIGGYLRCGNFHDVTKNKGHEKFMLNSLVNNGKESIYWSRVEDFISMVM